MHFELYKDHGGEWRWTLHANNGRKVADSGEGYKSKQHCEDAIGIVKRSAEAEVRERQSEGGR